MSFKFSTSGCPLAYCFKKIRKTTTEEEQGLVSTNIVKAPLKFHISSDCLNFITSAQFGVEVVDNFVGKYAKYWAFSENLNGPIKLSELFTERAYYAECPGRIMQGKNEIKMYFRFYFEDQNLFPQHNKYKLKTMI